MALKNDKMYIRNFWQFLIKFLGIWYLLKAFEQIPDVFNTLIYTLQISDTYLAIWYSFIVGLFLFGFYVLISFFLIFKSGWFIDQLKLMKDFQQERLQIELNEFSLIRLPVILFGGYLMAMHIPQAIKELFVLYRMNALKVETQGSEIILYHMLTAIFGYVVVQFNHRIAKWIHTEKNEDKLEDEL